MESSLGNLVLDTILAAIGADTVTFATSELWLLDEDFTPSPTLTVAELNRATTNGLGAITMSGTALDTSVDVVTGERRADAKPPVGGWHFETTSAPAAPITCYGVGWMIQDDGKLFKTWKFDDPIVFTASAQSYTFPLPVGFGILPAGIQ